MAIEYWQRAEDRSLGRATFGLEGGQAQEVYTSDGPQTVEQLNEVLTDVLGDVEATDDGLRRKLPLAHPVWPWLYASQVQFQGVGIKDGSGNTAGNVPAEEGLEAPPITDEVFLHVRQEMLVSFTPRPYAVVSDSTLEPETFDFYLPDGTTATGQDNEEHIRFTDVEIDPAPQVAHAQHGRMVFRTDSGAEPGNPAQLHTFAGHPYIVMPDGQFRVTWYQVPYSIFLNTDHPMWTYIGYVNQRDFFGQIPGRLLYMGAKARRYTPVVPFVAQFGESTIFSYEKLCDITFHFNFTSREVTDAPDLSSINGSWIASGHNVQPFWVDRKFYVVTSPDKSPPAETDRVPLFPSAPMEHLFLTS